jgi:hypothetical protein
VSDPTEVDPATDTEDKAKPKPPPEPTPPPMQPNSQIDGHKTEVTPKHRHRPT